MATEKSNEWELSEAKLLSVIRAMLGEDAHADTPVQSVGWANEGDAESGELLVSDYEGNRFRVKVEKIVK